MTVKGITREMMDAAIEAMNFHGFDIRAPWQCDLDDREREEYVGLQSAIAAALAHIQKGQK